MTLKSNKTEKKTVSFRLSLNDLAELHRYRQCLQDHNGFLGDRKISLSDAIVTAIDEGIRQYASKCGIPNQAWAISTPIEGETNDGLVRLITAWHLAILGQDGCTYIRTNERLISRLNAHRNTTTHYPIEVIDMRRATYATVPCLVVALTSYAICHDHGRRLPADDNARIAILRQIWAAAHDDGVVVVREPATGPYLDPIGRLPDRHAHKNAWVIQQRRM